MGSTRWRASVAATKKGPRRCEKTTVDRALERLIEQAGVRPQDRPQSAAALAAALRRQLTLIRGEAWASPRPGSAPASLVAITLAVTTFAPCVPIASGSFIGGRTTRTRPSTNWPGCYDESLRSKILRRILRGRAYQEMGDQAALT